MSVQVIWESTTWLPGHRPGAPKSGPSRSGVSRPAARWAHPEAGAPQPAVRPFPPAGRARPVRRPAPLAAASPVRPPVVACVPNYARRRLFALLLVGLVAAVTVIALSMLRAAAADDGVPERTAVVEVRSGESLWELAERVAPGSPPQAVVQRIRELNDMRGSTVHPGQPLVVPSAG